MQNKIILNIAHRIIMLILFGLITSTFFACSGGNQEDSATSSLIFDRISVSGIYPHLAVFNENHKTESPGETGIGAVVPWGDRLYVITYAAHKPLGSSDKLYIIDNNGNMEIFPGSVGGTPANRMIHRESEQLIIGPYFIRKNGDIRVIPQEKMPGRLTATSRHLEDPANKVYFYTMEEGLYEVDVHSLEVNEIYTDGNMMDPPDIAGPMLPGYHGKGAYTAQERLVVANNGEYRWQSTPESGCLAEWDGRNWTVIERKQFTEVTGPGGIGGYKNPDEQIWSTGWDEKSVILKLRQKGEWFTYRLPKAGFTYDGRHGWHTEWPRIRDVGMDNWLMTMHGMFWAFPPGFSNENISGLRPYSSYLKIIPDFARWKDKIILGCDDASIFDNALVGQPQSNLLFIDPDQLDDLGPRNAWGSIWLNEKVEEHEISDPFLTGGFDRMMIALVSEGTQAFKLNIERRKPGEKNWELWKTEIFGPYQKIFRIYDIDDETEWVRMSPDTELNGISLHLHLSEKDYSPQGLEVFKSLADIDDAEMKGFWIRPNGKDRNLSLFDAGRDAIITLNENLEFSQTEFDQETIIIKENLFPFSENIGADSASVFFDDIHGNRWRLPWGTGEYNEWYGNAAYRKVREVATERSLLNAGGIFYELPRDISGGIRKIKPISTHNKKITDFCSWRGLMAVTGTKPGAENDSHYFGNQDLNTGLWLGSIDDLWSLGKPAGKGGPWKNTPVIAGELSDPYLMLGFDKKELLLKHDSPEIIRFEIYADFTGNGIFSLIQVIQVNSGENKSFTFPDGFSANWLKIRINKACKASALLIYS